MPTPIVLVSADVREADGYVWHAAITTYLDAVIEGARATPLILPSYGEALDLDDLLDRVDGVLVTGSRTNVQPARYGAPDDPATLPHDPARDATTLPLIRRAIELGVPLFCICRGMQELNVALGGTLHPEVHEVEGRMDHRAPDATGNDARFAIRHAVEIRPGGRLAPILPDEEIAVNSLHRQALATLSPRLEIEATAPDGTVEAVSVRGAAGFAIGVQWHPEYWVTSDAPSARLFEAFAEAIRKDPVRRSAVR